MKLNDPTFKWLFSLAIGVIFLLFVDHYIGWQALLRPWKNAAPALLVIAFLVVLFSYIMRSLRLYYYFKPQLKGMFVVTIKLMLQHNVMNNLLPMRTGEISFPLLMRSFFKVPIVTSVAALLWFRLLDLHIIMGVGLASLIQTQFDFFYVPLFCLTWLCFPIVFYFSQQLTLRLLTQPVATTKFGKPFYTLLNRLEPGLPRDFKQFILCWLWTVINWLFKLVAVAWIILIFVDVEPAHAILGALGGELTSVLPFHGVAGLGTYEAGVVSALLPFGVDEKQALTGAVNTHLFMLSAALFGGLLSLFIKSPPSANNKSQHRIQ